jgi:hypothetical protein
MKIPTTQGEKLSMFMNIRLMQMLRDKGILTTDEIDKIVKDSNELTFIKEHEDFQEDLR